MKNKKKNIPKGRKRVGKGRLAVVKKQAQQYSTFSKLRAIGNSQGVILPNRVVEEAGITPDADLIIQVSEGVILIAEAGSPGSVNTNLSSWDAQFKKAIKKGKKPESDVWEGVQNRFDKEEWT